jgi:hypothetical protein
VTVDGLPAGTCTTTCVAGCAWNARRMAQRRRDDAVTDSLHRVMPGFY